MADRILYLTLDPFSTGGIQRLGRHVLDALASADVDVFSPGIPDRSGNASAVHIASDRDVVRLARQRRPGLVLCDHVHLAPLARAASAAAGGAYAVMVYAIEVWRLLPPRQRRALVGADRVLSVCRFTERLLVSRHPALTGRVAVIGGCVDVERFTPGPPDANARQRLGNRPVVLTVSRLAPGRPKGHEQIFEALATLSAEGCPFTYLVVGDGADRPRLEQLAWAVGVGEHVRFLGAVTDERLSDLYRLCDVFVLASAFRIGWRNCQGEAMGLVSLEAQASGRPVVASRLDGSAEAIVDGETGLLVDPHDTATVVGALRSLLRDPERRSNMGAAAREHVVQRFSPHAFAGRVRDALQPWLASEAIEQEAVAS